MPKKPLPKVAIEQLEEALEERQTPDRRQKQAPLPAKADRRKNDRRGERQAKG